LRDPETSGFRPDMSVSEATDLALDLDHGLIAMYEELVRRAESESLRDMLVNLLDAERREEIQLMRTQSST
jgi:rubrerythrin